MARRQFTPEEHSVRVLKVGERVRHVLSEILTRQQAPVLPKPGSSVIRPVLARSF